MGKKKFIDKKNSVHFHLVRRSQRDPLISDENSSPFVLVPTFNPNSRQKVPKGIEFDAGNHGSEGDEEIDEEELAKMMEEADFSEEEKPASETKPKEREKEKEKGKGKGKVRETGKGKEAEKTSNQNVGEAAKFGIMFDDTGYDYTQHLKDMGAPGAVFIPAVGEAQKKKGGVTFKESVTQMSIEELIPADALPSKYEEEIGLLNLAAPVTGPQPELGEDILEVLEALEDEAFEGDLEDDFVQALVQPAADGEGEDEDDWDGEEYADDESYGDRPDFDSNSDEDFNDNEKFETKSRLTNYSMTSSVMARTKELQNLDDRFEKIMEDYEDDEIGELEEDDPRVQGLQNINNFENILDKFLEDHQTDLAPKGQSQAKAIDKVLTKEEILNALDAIERTPAKKSEIQETKKAAWDCESIISTYSNLENHPSLIREQAKKQILLDKTGVPREFISQSRRKNEAVEEPKPIVESFEGEEESDGVSESGISVPARSKDETPEEKKERKKAVKEMKKQRRQEKKATKAAFKSEKVRQERLKFVANQNPNAIPIN